MQRNRAGTVLVATDWSHPVAVRSALDALVVGSSHGFTVRLTICVPHDPTPADVAQVQQILARCTRLDGVAIDVASFEECAARRYDVCVVPNGNPCDLVERLARLSALVLGESPGEPQQPGLEDFIEPEPLPFATGSALPARVGVGIGHPDNAFCAFPVMASPDRRVTIGRFTYGPALFRLWRPEDRIEIGSFTSVAQGVKIMGGGEHFTHFATTYPLRQALDLAVKHNDDYPTRRGPTVIGSDVWIGDNVVITSGVRVGHGAVIGAGSVVTRDVPPYAVVAGNPAVMRRRRFDDDTVEALLAVAWWEWPLARISEFAPLLSSGRVASLLELGSEVAAREA